MVKRMWPTPTVMTRPNEGSVRLLRARVLDGTLTEEEARAMLNGKSPFEAQGKLAARPSEASSPGSAASTSASSEQAGTDDGRSNGTTGASESLPSTGPMFPELETSETLTPLGTALLPTPTATGYGANKSASAGAAVRPSLQTMARHGSWPAPAASNPSISSPAASPASRSATPGSDSARKTTAGSGPSSPVLLASYDPATSSWRTCQDSWLDMEGWGQSLETWPPSGMTRNGTAYRLPPSVPRTSATGSGSSLQEWHTPTASDRDGKPKWDKRASPGHVRKVPVPNLMAQILDSSPDLGAEPGSLNPTWVEWLMGFPLGWTACEHSATRSSRKSSKRSAED